MLFDGHTWKRLWLKIVIDYSRTIGWFVVRIVFCHLDGLLSASCSSLVHRSVYPPSVLSTVNISVGCHSFVGFVEMSCESESTMVILPHRGRGIVRKMGVCRFCTWKLLII